MENGKSIMVQIKSSQTDSQGAIDSMEFYTEGRYYEKKDSRYISYEESEISGLQGTIDQAITNIYIKLLRQY